jgi:hypothetical protein
MISEGASSCAKRMRIAAVDEARIPKVIPRGGGTKMLRFGDIRNTFF